MRCSTKMKCTIIFVHISPIDIVSVCDISNNTLLLAEKLHANFDIQYSTYMRARLFRLQTLCEIKLISCCCFFGRFFLLHCTIIENGAQARGIQLRIRTAIHANYMIVTIRADNCCWLKIRYAIYCKWHTDIKLKTTFKYIANMSMHIFLYIFSVFILCFCMTHFAQRINEFQNKEE